MMVSKLSASILAVAALCAAALGQSGYASRYHTVHAGVLVVRGNALGVGDPGYANEVPHIWNNLDQNTLVKPASWNFENPAAPSTVTSDIVSRWGATLGDPIRKDNAAYWEVALTSQTDAQLAEYDVLVLPAYHNLILTGFEAARLRRFMDNGGTLWVDVQSTTVGDISNALTLPIQLSTSSGSRAADFLSSMMNRPFNISMADIRSSEYPGETGAFGTPGVDALDPIMGSSGRISPVVLDGALATVGTSPVGNGYLVVTTRGLGRVLNQGAGDYANNGYQSKNVAINRATIAAGKLIVNAISLNSGHGQVAQGSRATNAIISDLGAPLLPSFTLHGAGQGASGVTRPAVFYKGLMVITSEDTLYVYSAKPGTSLDGTGTLDYGLTDYALGSSYDLIWTAALTGPISTPTCVEVPGAVVNGLPKDQILIADGSGNLVAFDAFQLDVNRHIRTGADLLATPPVPAYTITPSTGASARGQTTVPSAPTYHEGVVYIADAQASSSTAGRIWIANPSTGLAFSSESQEFSLGGTAAALFGEFSAAPTVGYIPVQDNSGAMDKVIYLPAYQVPGGSGPTSTAAIFSFWMGVKGEAYKIGTDTTDAVRVGDTLQIPLRAFSQNLHVYYTIDPNDPLGLHVSATHLDGRPYSNAELATIFTGGWSTPDHAGTETYATINLVGGADVSDVAQIRVDYSIDWGMAGTNASAFIRGVLYLPDDTTHARNILGNLALTPSGNLIAVLSQGTPPLTDPTSTTAMAQKGGSVYNFSEKGRGIFRLNYRYEAYDAHTIQTNQGSNIYYPEAFTDNDPQVSASLANGTPDSNGVLPNAIQNLTFTSPPTVRDGVVYVTAAGWKNTTDPDPANWLPVSVVVALKENPDPVVIFTGDLSVNFQIVQPDICSSDDKSNPTHFTVLQPNQYVYNKEPGNTVGTLTMSNLMDRDNGSIGNALSTNQPLLLRQAGAPDQLLEPNQTPGATWSPMLWYAVFPGYHLDGATMATGDTLFGTGWSVLPGLINGLPNLYSTRVASVVAFNTGINSNDASSFTTDTRRFWMSQAHVFGGSGSSVASTNLLWPTGITDVYSIATRVGQESLQGSASGVHVTAGDGIMAITGDSGLYAYDSSGLVITDSGRVARFSPSGDTQWSSESTFASASLRDTGGSSLSKPLVTPTRAYPFKGDTLIVDSGANRVIRMADTGREIRSIDKVQLDPGGYRPDGLAANEQLTLNRPSDVAAYSEYLATGDARLGAVSNPQALEYWVHYLIADTGNHRLVDAVDRFYADPTTGEIGDPVSVAGVPQVGVLLWHSPSNYSGKNWAYNSIARTQIVDSSGATPVIKDVIAAGIGNAATSTSDLGLGGSYKGVWASGSSYVVNDVVKSPATNQRYVCIVDAPSSTTDPSLDTASFVLFSGGESTGNGSIVLFDAAGTIVINKVRVPASAGNIFWNPTTAVFGPDSLPDRYKTLSNLTSVTLSRSSTSNYPIVMFTDSSGVYEVVNSGSDWVVRWMMPTNVYTALRGVNAPYGGTGQPAGEGTPAGNPVALRANFARRLDEDHVLLVNGLVSGDFKGEIVVVSGTIDASNTNSVPGFGFNKTNLGFGTNSIRYQLQDVRGSRAIQGPVFADRR